MFYLKILPWVASSAPANLSFHVWKMRGLGWMTSVGSYDGCCSSPFRGIPQSWEHFSPAPPEGALALLSGFGDYIQGADCWVRLALGGHLETGL